MIFRIQNILNQDDLLQINNVCAQAEWVSGKETAAGSAGQAKENLILRRQDSQSVKLNKLILEALMDRGPQFSEVTYPARIFPMLFSRYDQGMSYGDHVDNSILGQPQPMRTDISITIFLNDPDEYEGGELVIQSSSGQVSFKANAGDLVGYPSVSVHRVEPVTRGSRLVAVTWVQSMVNDPLRRAVLYDLSRSIASLKSRVPDAPELLTLGNSFHTLVRMWAQP
jgi:PKHD-type hydroxylase